MKVFLIVLPLIAPWLFDSNVEQALTFARDGQWASATAALDRAYAQDASLFAANNLHYLRGRMAENQRDWNRALVEFELIDLQSSLRPLADWHSARVSMGMGDVSRAVLILQGLPRDFPAEMKLQLAREAPPQLALEIYTGLTTREARFRRAEMLGQNAPLWTLMRESDADDVGLAAARKLAPTASAPRDLIEVAGALMAHRQFAEAAPLYERAASDPQFAADALFQIARIHFLKEDYEAAVEAYQTISQRFDGTDTQKEADYQLASCYWRMARYSDAEKVYAAYIARYSGSGVQEGAIRNLVDVYRAMGEPNKALTLLDKTLARRLTTPTRQVFLFTKGKILYGQKRYSAALETFKQLSRMTIRSAPGGTSADEVRYFEAMSQLNLGNKTSAKAIWTRLAANPLTYYGQKAAVQLGQPSRLTTAIPACQSTTDPALDGVLRRLASRRRPARQMPDIAADAVSELVYMQLWDEASIWIERQRRPVPLLAADLAYAAGRYDRAIAHTDRLPKSEATTLSLRYPAGFRQTVCEAAQERGVDPLWMHAIIWQESKYNAGARSGASARGLMQFIPDTAAALSAEAGIPDLTLDLLYQPATNIRLGAYYWSLLLAEFKQPELALAAYNGGPGNVRRWRDKWPGADAELFVSDIGFIETKRYVQAVVGARAAYGEYK